MARVHLLTSCAALVLVHLALALDFPGTPVWPSGTCTDKSLTIPSWTISDYKSSSGTTTFSVANRAAGTAGSVSCSSLACTVSGDAKLSVSLSSASGGPLVSLKESWNCSDLGRTLHFDATGSASIFSLQCSGTDCSSPIPYLAYGSLSAPVPLTPAQPSPSKGYNTSTCLDANRSGLWSVSQVSFKNYTEYQCSNPAGGYCLSGDAISQGLYLKLTLRNNAIDWSVDCDLTISEDPFSPLKNTAISCASGGFNDISANVVWTGVAPNFQLQVDSVWYCLDNPMTNVIPSAILATASGSVPLDCTSKPGNSGKADDIITTCTLASNSRAIDGKLVKRESEAAFSLVSAPPASGGCTVDSVLKPTWRVLPTFKTYIAPPWSPSNSSLWEVVVRLGNPAYQHDFFSTPGPQGLPGRSDPNTVYYCDWGEVGFRLPWNCTFAFDWNSYKLWLNDVWECSEKDAAHPLYFTGEGTIDLSQNPKPTCSIDNNRDLYYCYWQNTLDYPIPKVTVSLTNVSPPQGNKALPAGR